MSNCRPSIMIAAEYKDEDTASHIPLLADRFRGTQIMN